MKIFEMTIKERNIHMKKLLNERNERNEEIDSLIKIMNQFSKEELQIMKDDRKRLQIKNYMNKYLKG